MVSWRGQGWGGALGRGPQSQAASEKGGKDPRASLSVRVKVRHLILPGCTLVQNPCGSLLSVSCTIFCT